MRRAVALAALVATLAGCSPDTSAPDERKPVPQEITLELYQRGGIDLFEVQASWGHNTVADQKEKLLLPVWTKKFTVTWPDDTYVWVTGVAQPKPGVDHGLAYVNGTPQVRCVLRVNGKVVSEQTNAFPQCDATLTATPPPAPSGTAG
jgi:hypothetical protein